MPRICRPGWELEKILASHWIVPDAAGEAEADSKIGPKAEAKARRGILGTEGGGCNCVQHAKIMDQQGPDWCEQNIDQIVGWMKAEAKRRGWLVFSKTYAKQLVRLAIKRARKAREKFTTTAPTVPAESAPS